jgi:hypothetical protein
MQNIQYLSIWTLQIAFTEYVLHMEVQACGLFVYFKVIKWKGGDVGVEAKGEGKLE